MTSRDTIPLPLAVHLAMYVVIGLFCAFAGPLNLIEPVKIIPNGALFLAVCGVAWGYVFGVFMGRREAVMIGWGLSGFCFGIAAWLWGRGDMRLAALLVVVGLYGFAVLFRYGKWVLGLADRR